MAVDQTPGKSPVRAEEIREGHLYGVLIQAQTEPKELPDWFITNQIRAAEDHYEHELQLFFGVKRVKSDPQGRELATDTYDVAVPATDYDRDFFTEGRWGWHYFDYRPIVEVESFFFSYPGTDRAQSYEVPTKWLRIDYKLGRCQLFPTTGPAVIATFNAWVMSVLAGGRGLPQSLFVDYKAGLSQEELLRNHQDLLEALRINATLGCFPTLTNVRTSGLGSRSLSMDGLSRSEGFGAGKYGTYSGIIEQYKEREKELTKSWRDAEKGVISIIL